MTTGRTPRQLQIERSGRRLRLRAKIESNKEVAKRKMLENRKLRQELKTI